MSKKKIYGLRILVFLTLLVVFAVFIESIIFDKFTVLTILISLIFLGLKEDTFMNPYYFFALTPLSLLSYYNVIDFYMLDLTHNTYLLAIINILAFMYALVLGPLKRVKKIYSKRESNSASRVKIILLFSLSLVAYIVPSLYSIFWLFSIPAMVYALRSKEKNMFILVIGYILFTAAISLSKTAVLLYILTFLICLNKFYNLTGKEILWLKLFSVFGIVLLIYSFSFANKDRGNYDADDGYEYYARQGSNWEYDVAYFLPYMYFSTPWTNLQYVTESQDSRTYGLWALKPFINYVQLDDNFKKEYKLVPYSSFNTFTFVAVAFKDFGYWFSILSSLILGFFVKKVYSRFLVSQSPFDTATYVIFALATVEMFFSNHFFMVSYPFTMLILMWLTKFFVYNFK